jgi:GNAT acetyltransferase-like protein
MIINSENNVISNKYCIEVCTTIEGIQKIRSDWQKLQFHPNADIDFYLGIVESRREIIRPHVVLVTENGHTKAMMIGRIENSRLALKVGYKSIYAIQIKLLTIIYHGFLGDMSEDVNNIFITEILQLLKKGDADAFFVNSIHVDSNICRLIREKPNILCRDHLHTDNIHWQMSVPANIDQFYERMSAHRRHELRRYPKVLEKKFPKAISIECFQSVNDVDRILTDAETVAKKTYHRGLGVGFTDNIENRRRLTLFANKGLLRAYLMYIQDKPSAFWIGTEYGKVFYLDFTAFDPEFKKYETGTILFLKMVEDLCKTDCRAIDFGFGDALYKRSFGNKSWKECSYYVFAPTMKGMMLNVMRTGMGSLISFVEYLLIKTKLLQYVKKHWRKLLIKQTKAYRG